MAKVKKHDFIRENMEVLKTLVKSGDVSVKLINDFVLHRAFINHDERSQMQRYQDVAGWAKVSTVTVRKAVKSMESKV